MWLLDRIVIDLDPEVEEFVDELEHFDPKSVADALVEFKSLSEDASYEKKLDVLEELFYALEFEHSIGSLSAVSTDAANKLLDVLDDITEDDRPEVVEQVLEKVHEILD